MAQVRGISAGRLQRRGTAPPWRGSRQCMLGDLKRQKVFAVTGAHRIRKVKHYYLPIEEFRTRRIRSICFG